MTMIAINPLPTRRWTIHRLLLMLAARARRALNGWIASILARREQQAGRVALSQMDDRALKDIGLYRGQIFQPLESAAIARARHLPLA